jgi:chromosome segregation ATPase
MSEIEMKEKKNNTPALTAIIVLLVILLGTMTYLWSSKNGALKECTAKNLELQADINEMNNMMAPFLGSEVTNDLMSDFSNMMNTYDALMKKDASQSDSLIAQKEKIQGLMNELESAKKNGQVSASLIAKLKRENETLRQIMISYVKQIDQLNTLNLKLTSELDETTNQLQDTKTERDQYKDQAEQSQAQVKKGSKLNAYGFSSSGLRMKINNTTEATTKAKNAVQAKSTFTIGENTIANAGNKEVFMQIMNPDGKVIQGRSGGTTTGDEGAFVYSAKREIQYNNKAIDVTIYYDFNGEEPVKGNYKVKIFCDGQVIGTDSFTLK